MKQRRFPRIQLNSKVFIRTTGRSFSANSENLSMHGIFVNTNENIAKGASVELDIMVPCASRCPYMKIHGMINRVEQSGVAIEFTRMEPDVFLCLKNVIQKRSPHRLKPYMGS